MAFQTGRKGGKKLNEDMGGGYSLKMETCTKKKNRKKKSVSGDKAAAWYFDGRRKKRNGRKFTV